MRERERDRRISNIQEGMNKEGGREEGGKQEIKMRPKRHAFN